MAVFGDGAFKEIIKVAAAAAAKSRQSCPTLCDPIDGSPTGSSVPGILQARTLEWVAISFSNHESESEVTQSCPTLRDPMDCSPPGSSVHGIFQVRVLEWGAIAFSELRLNEVINMGITNPGRISVLIRRDTRALSLPLPLPTLAEESLWRDMVKRQPSANQKANPHQELNWPES